MFAVVFYNVGLGSAHTKNLGFGYNGARLGSLNLRAYNPDHYVSVLVRIPLYDLRNGNNFFALCLFTLQDAAYAAREALAFRANLKIFTITFPVIF